MIMKLIKRIFYSTACCYLYLSLLSTTTTAPTAASNPDPDIPNFSNATTRDNYKYNGDNDDAASISNLNLISTICKFITTTDPPSQPLPPPPSNPPPKTNPSIGLFGEVALAIHNIYRCMHDIPLLVWDDCVAQGAQEWANRGVFEHSSSYKIQPCKGPAGENLASGHASIVDAVNDFYAEKKVWDRSPQNNYVGGAGHFTAMMWRGISKLGCAANSNKRLFVCRYKGSDRLDCNTPNMSGCFSANILPVKYSKEECERKLQQQTIARVESIIDV